MLTSSYGAFQSPDGQQTNREASTCCFEALDILVPQPYMPTTIRAWSGQGLRRPGFEVICTHGVRPAQNHGLLYVLLLPV